MQRRPVRLLTAPGGRFGVRPGRAEGVTTASYASPAPRRAIGRRRSPHALLAWILAVCLVLAGQALAVTPTSAEPTDTLLDRTSTDRDFAAGSYIIDMGAGVTNGVQDKLIGLEPYGLIYRLLVTAKVPVYWIIKDDKTGAVQTAPSLTNLSPDMTATVVGFKPTATTTPVTKNYYSSAFVVPDEFMDDATLAALIAFSTPKALTQVRVDKATAPFTAPVFDKIIYWPKATLDGQNGDKAATYYTNAGISGPSNTAAEAIQIASTSFNWKDPQTLNGCDDIFVMPHAEPEWATHSNLLPWNRDNQGYIWAGCHAVSEMENLDDPSDAGTDPNLNFLSTNGLLSDAHADGVPPNWYGSNLATAIDSSTLGTTIGDRSDPIVQFIGFTDLAHRNGAEFEYLPKAGSAWRSSVRLISWDPDHANVVPTSTATSPGEAATILYGRAFDDTSRGLVMYEGGHSLDGVDSAAAPAQRAFFNFILLGGIENAPKVNLTMPPAKEVKSGETITLSTQLSGGSAPYDYTWTSSCGGSFSNGSGTDVPAGTYTTTFTAPVVDAEIGCQLRAVVADACNRQVFDAGFIVVQPLADVAITKTASPAVAPADTDITYTLTATNNGPSTATGVTVTDTLPAGVTYVSASGDPTVSPDSKTLTWNVGSLAKHATQTFTVTVRAGTTAGTVTNTATVATTSVDLETANNTATAATTIVNSSIAITKVPDKTLIDRDGDTVTFTFEVRNTGENALHSVHVADNPVCTTITGPAGDVGEPNVLLPFTTGGDQEVWTYTCTTTVNASTDVEPNSAGVQDRVTVTARDTGDYQISSSATATVTLAAPAIAVTKELFPADQRPAPGQNATFKIVVTNTGTVPLTNVGTVDSWDVAPSQPPSQCTTSIPNLAVGESYELVCAAKMPATATWGTLASDNFDTPAIPHATDSYTSGTGWPEGSVWDEEGTTTDSATAGDIRVVTATLPAGGTSSNVLRIASNRTYIQRAIPTVTRTDSVKLAFNYFRSLNFNGGNNDVDVQACTDAAAATCPIIGTISKRAATGADDAWQQFSPIVLPVGTTAVRFDPQDDLRTDKYFFIDNVVITSADFINNVTASGTDQFGDTVTNTASSGRITPGTSSLAITKSATPPADGFPLHNTDPFTYTVTVQNTGSIWQTGVTVADALPDGLVLTSGQPVTATKTHVLKFLDAFDSATYGAGWVEITDTTQSAILGKTQIVSTGNPANALSLDVAAKIKLQRDLSGSTGAYLRFDCKHQGLDSTDDKLLVTATGSTTAFISVVQNSTLCSSTGFVSTGYWALPESALVAGAEITFDAAGNKDFWLDNVEIVTTNGTPQLVPAGTPSTDPSSMLSTAGGYSLAPDETITFTVPVRVAHGPANGTSYVNIATADSTQSDPVSAAVTTAYLPPNAERVVKIQKQALNCDTNQPTCPLPGAEFTLYTSDPLAPNPVAGVPLTKDAAGTTFTTDKLRVERDYWIVETKAPAEFQLLAQPIQFHLTESLLELDAASASGLVSVSGLTTPTSGTPYFTLTVTNLPAAELPVTGGHGYWPYLSGGFALLLVAGACFIKTSGPRPAPRRVAP